MKDKSNDSFQWTDELVREYGYWYFETITDGIKTEDLTKEFLQRKQSHTPKPQAENKPQPQKEEQSRFQKLSDEYFQKLKSTEQRIEVTDFRAAKKYADPRINESCYQFVTSTPVAEEKFPLIKQAIEQVLNDEGVYSLLDDVTNNYFKEKLKYQMLEKKVDELCEKVAIDFIYYTEFVMDDDDWLDDDGMKSMKQVYKEFTEWRNKKQTLKQ